MIRVVIGTEPNQFAAQKVLEYSIRRNASEEVEIHVLTQNMERRGGTNFGFVRFMIPDYFGYRGRAIYLDADQLVLSDIAGLWNSLDEQHAVAVVQDPVGCFGGKKIGHGNQTSVMVMNCERLRDWDPEVMFDKVVHNRSEPEAGEIRYRDFMMLAGMDPACIQALDYRWNSFNLVTPETCLIHFSHVRTQPWKKPDHEFADFWEQWLRDCVASGYLKRWQLLREIMKGHVHRHFLPCVFGGRKSSEQNQIHH